MFVYFLITSAWGQTCDTATSLIGDVNNHVVADAAITTSSTFNTVTPPRFSRLDTIGAWSAAQSDYSQWIEVDLGQVKVIESVTSQGRANVNQWVTKYKVLYSIDGVSFEPAVDSNGGVIEFSGNVDQSTPVTNTFPEPIVARYVLLSPTDWNSWISLRWDLDGCDYSGEYRIYLLYFE